MRPVLKLQHALKSAGGLVKPQIAGPSSGVSNSLNLGWDQGYAFQSSSQVTKLLVLEPHFENHGSDQLQPLISVGGSDIKY